MRVLLLVTALFALLPRIGCDKPIHEARHSAPANPTAMLPA
jgi:hypothetical protein